MAVKDAPTMTAEAIMPVKLTRSHWATILALSGLAAVAHSS